mgnify:CR=1 FL=1
MHDLTQLHDFQLFSHETVPMSILWIWTMIMDLWIMIMNLCTFYESNDLWLNDAFKIKCQWFVKDFLTYQRNHDLDA